MLFFPSLARLRQTPCPAGGWPEVLGFTAALTASLLLATPASAQSAPPPIFDMHLHALHADGMGPPPLGLCVPVGTSPAWDQRVPFPIWMMGQYRNPDCEDPVWTSGTDGELLAQTLEILERRNVFGLLSGRPELLPTWLAAAPDRLTASLWITVQADGALAPGIEEAREAFTNGPFRAMGEILTQYAGILPTDDRLAPYWALAEELDLPVGIHVGSGPPGAAYAGSPRNRAGMGSPLTMEEVLLRHPNLRVYLMHGGWPFLDDLIALMYAHPQVHVDVGAIAVGLPRAEFHGWLERIVGMGFHTRILFGSDQMQLPSGIDLTIEAIENAPFLTEGQKRDIFYHNAARFLRLGEEEIARHYRGGRE